MSYDSVAPAVGRPYSHSVNSATDDASMRVPLPDSETLDENTPLVGTGAACTDGRVGVVYVRRWYILFLFSMVGFMQGMAWNTWGPLAVSATVAFGWSDATIALLTNWGAITFIVASFPFAWIMDVKGLRWATVIITSFLTLGTGLRCITFSDPAATWLINIGQILVGLGGPVVMGAPPLLSATWFPAHQRTTSTAISAGLNGIGVACSFVLGPWIVDVISSNSASAYIIPANASQINSSDIYPTPDLHHLKDQFMTLMYIEFGLCALLLALILLYFPGAPPNAPSVTASLDRINPLQGLAQICKLPDFWIIGGSYAVSSGVYNVFTAVIVINLAPLKIPENTIGYIVFWSVLIGNITAMIVSRFADLFARRMKMFLLVLYSVCTVAFGVFALESAGYIPKSIALLYVTMIVGSVAIDSAIPLLYELLCETTYPVAEGLTNTAATTLNNLCGMIFLLVMMIPMASTVWTNWTLFGCVAVCIPIFLTYKESYRRLDIDTASPPAS